MPRPLAHDGFGKHHPGVTIRPACWTLPPPQLGACARCGKTLELYGPGVVWTTESDTKTGITRAKQWHPECRREEVAEINQAEALAAQVDEAAKP